MMLFPYYVNDYNIDAFSVKVIVSLFTNRQETKTYFCFICNKKEPPPNRKAAFLRYHNKFKIFFSLTFFHAKCLTPASFLSN